MYNKVAGSVVALVLLHAVVELLLRRRILRPADMEHMVARLTMRARRYQGSRFATASAAGAEVVRGWLIEAGDEPPPARRPRLAVVRDDE